MGVTPTLKGLPGAWGDFAMRYLAVALVSSLAFAVPAGAGDLVGTVRLVGAPPPAELVTPTTDHAVCGAAPRPVTPVRLSPDDGVQDAVVFLANQRLEGWRMPSTTFVMDQRDCKFIPSLIVIPPGATLEVHNSDPSLHNFHTLSVLNPRMNLGQRAGGRPLSLRFDRPEFVPVHCDVHGRGVMRAWVVVAAHPHFAVTDANGAFRLPDAPMGPHTLAVWHPRLGEVRVPVTIGATGEVRVDIAFPSPVGVASPVTAPVSP